jgi:uncharacterized protein (TIGR00159 family)
MTELFIHIRFLDLLDILLVAFILYEIYHIIKGTVAFNIFMGIFIVYLIWLIVKALNMELVSSILGQLFGVGVLALIVVFQQEIRKFLLLLGRRYRANKKFSFVNLFPNQFKSTTETNLRSIVDACSEMASVKTGALIVIARDAELLEYTDTGSMIDAEISEELLKSIFFKNSPLHDGAVIISGNKIKAARCILPVSGRTNLKSSFGLRHRAAVGMSEETDAYIIIVSEETGRISLAHNNNITENISASKLFNVLEENHVG